MADCLGEGPAGQGQGPGQGEGVNATAGDSQGRGTYPLAEAARLSHLPALTVRRWIQGYDYTSKGQRRHSEPISYLADAYYDAKRTAVRPSTRRPTPVLDFEQLLTLMLVRAFKKRGLGLPKIKKAAARARERYNLENPFVTKQFRSDGNRIFVDLAPSSKGRERELVDVLSDQRQFRDIVEPSLFKDVVFAGDRAGQWWPLGQERKVLVSPRIQFGAPHIAGTGVRTDVIAQMVAAEGGGGDAVDGTAGWFGLTPEQVTDAVEFEGPWLSEPPD